MRRMMIAWVLLLPMCGLSQIDSPRRPNAFPTAQQRSWQDLGVGMFLHFAPNAWQDREYDDLSTPLQEINPARLDTDQWADTAAKMGAKYIVFVAKHAGGFCMWQTNTTDYSLKSTPWRGGKGDIVADLAASCRKRGIKLGLYLSPQDTRHGAGNGGRCKTAEEQPAYNDLYRRQLTELLSKYGEITEIWFDGSVAVPVGDILKKFAPDAMIFQGPHATIRWVGNEQGFAPYPAWNSLPARDARTGIATAMHGDPDGDAWMPNEVDVSLRRPNWFWSTTNHNRIMTLDQLMEIFYRSVGRGANLLLNLTPDRSGLIPAADVARVEEFGREVRRRFGRSLAETHGSGDTLELKFKEPAGIDHVIIQEDTRRGERVREYVIEGKTHGIWTPLGGGTAIGQMRVQPVEPITLEGLRLRSTQAAGSPQIRRLAVFATNSPPPKSWNDPPRVWAGDAAGRWVNGQVDLDLSKRIDTATQYRLRFVPEGGGPAGISEAEVLLDGIARPDLLQPESGRFDSLILTIPAIGHKVQLRARMQGVGSGTVLIQKR